MSDELKVALTDIANDQVCLEFTMAYWSYIIIQVAQLFVL